MTQHITTNLPTETGIRRHENPIMALAERVLSSGASPDAAASAIEKMMVVFNAQEDRLRKDDFDAAMAKIQAEITHVIAKRSAKASGSFTGFNFANEKDVDDMMRPLLVKYGFTVSFSYEYEGPITVAICSVSYGGHTRSNRYGVKDSDTVKAASMAARWALCKAFHVIIDREGEDSRLKGGTISDEDAARLEDEVKKSGANRAVILETIGTTSFRGINAYQRQTAMNMVKIKNNSSKPKTPPYVENGGGGPVETEQQRLDRIEREAAENHK